MTDQPSRVTPAEIGELLDHARSLAPNATLDEQIAYHARKANLLSRIAADLDTPESYEASAEAWHHLAGLCRRADERGRAEAES